MPYDNPSAFPLPIGVSLRDYFAAKALQGMMVNGFKPIEWYEGSYSTNKEYLWAETAYAIAEKMLIQREKIK